MHAKLCLLRYEAFLRVMISSGNQIEHEWRDSVEVSWICDFPKRFASGSAGRVLGGGAAVAAPQKQSCGPFAADLSEFVALCLSHPEYEHEKNEWCTAITSEFDVSVAEGVSLVASVPGQYGPSGTGVVEMQCGGSYAEVECCHEWVAKRSMHQVTLDGAHPFWVCERCKDENSYDAWDDDPAAAEYYEPPQVDPVDRFGLGRMRSGAPGIRNRESRMRCSLVSCYPCLLRSCNH